jgi:uncharacterized protein with HEPN domain
MTSARDQIDYIADILDSIERIEEFTSRMSYEDFAADDKTVYAVIRALEIIGEAAKRISEATREQYPSVPWREMAATRDKLIHGYIGIDLEVIWHTLKADLPAVKEDMTRILSEATGAESPPV